MTDLTEVREIAVGAMLLADYLGSALVVAVLGAAWEAVFPGTPSRVGNWLVSALRMAVRLLCLVIAWPALLPYRLTVTYLHVGGRHGRHEHQAGEEAYAYIDGRPVVVRAGRMVTA